MAPLRALASRGADLFASSSPRWRLDYEDLGKALSTGLGLGLVGFLVELAGWLASGLAELDPEAFSRLALRVLAWILFHLAILFPKKAPTP